MTLPALVTFGVDSTVLQAYAAQVGMGGASSALTPDRVSEVVSGAAARVCGTLRRAGISPSDVAGDTASATYALCRRATALLALPTLLRSVQLGAGPAFDSMAREAQELLKLLVSDPEAWGSGTADLAPGVDATTDGLDPAALAPSWRTDAIHPQLRRTGSHRT